MSASTIVYALLSGSAPLAALVGTKVYPVVLPESQSPPAVIFEEVSTVDIPTIDGTTGAYALRRSRIQVNCIAVQFGDAQAILDAVCSALMFARGTIGGEQVVTITRERTGPNLWDQDLNLHNCVADFFIVWRDL